MPICQRILLLITLLTLAGVLQAQVLLRGSVLDVERQPVAGANIIILESGKGTSAQTTGAFELTLPFRKVIALRIEAIGYQTLDTVVATFSRNLPPFSIILEHSFQEIDQVSVVSRRQDVPTLEHIDFRTVNSLAGSSLGVEQLIKTLPGVQATNELSSQYSVRGGSFDENLVYIDGTEVYRPTLIRSGNQEGLSVINPDMIERLTFSAGGFPANFGDRMSSVLNIQYRTPRKLGAKVLLGLLENRLLLEGVTPNENFSSMLGLRYKTTRLLLRTTDVKGDYTPSFLDLQGKIVYKISPDLRLEFLGGLARNSYEFVPKVKKTQVGSLAGDFRSLHVYYEGREQDLYNTSFANLALHYSPTPDWKLEAAAKAFHTVESEAFDILGEYWLQSLHEEGQGEQNDSLANFGVGGAYDHARNYFNAWVAGGRLRAQYSWKEHNVQAGISAYEHHLNHRLSEWHIVDSAGYTLPTHQLAFDTQNSMHAEGRLRYLRFAGFTNLHLNFALWATARLELDGGLRLTTRDLWSAPILSPRLALTFVPKRQSTFATYLASGFYYQFPFYREMRDNHGELHPKLQPQRAIHLVLGSRWSFPLWEIPFRIQLELYQKNISNLIPYHVENLSLRYEAANIGEGLIRGIDLKIHGELVPGAESWLSVSLLKASMRLKEPPRDPLQTPQSSGYFPMPSDQRFAVSLFLQDYLPRLPSYTVHLTAHYATGLPFTPPNAPYGLTGRLPSYKRVDIGFEKEFKSDIYSESWLRKAKWLKEFRLGVEVLNLLDIANTSSYLWVAVPTSQGTVSRLAVPNYLTARCINFRLRLGF